MQWYLMQLTPSIGPSGLGVLVFDGWDGSIGGPPGMPSKIPLLGPFDSPEQADAQAEELCKYGKRQFLRIQGDIVGQVADQPAANTGLAL